MILSDSTTNGKMGPEWVRVEGGTFQMGDGFGDGIPDEKPVHSVTLVSFYVSKYEVTQGLYKSVIGNNPSRLTGDDNLPVEMVSWYDAIKFCNALSLRDGFPPCYAIHGTDVTCNFNVIGYRLPTEAEWEYAARGGSLSQGYKYSGSNTAGDVSWNGDNSGFLTHPVGTKAPNELGIYDMSGNVFEWCWDWYGKYESEAQINPLGPSGRLFRVNRGGSMLFKVQGVSVASRSNCDPAERSKILGCRLFKTI
jgi:formylglycine-generating enzyme required for sulfatase activity